MLGEKKSDLVEVFDKIEGICVYFVFLVSSKDNCILTYRRFVSWFLKNQRAINRYASISFCRYS